MLFSRFSSFFFFCHQICMYFLKMISTLQTVTHLYFFLYSLFQFCFFSLLYYPQLRPLLPQAFQASFIFDTSCRFFYFLDISCSPLLFLFSTTSIFLLPFYAIVLQSLENHPFILSVVFQTIIFSVVPSIHLFTLSHSSSTFFST